MRAGLRRLLATIERLGTGRAGLLRLAALVTVLLGSVAFQGFQVDDYWQRNYLLVSPRWPRVTGPWWTLFSFFDGDPARMASYREDGAVAWWADDHARLSFFRPLSCLTHLVDYRLWPTTPGLMHLHSLAWYLALVLVAALLYRRLLPPSLSALAALLYAVDHNHGGVAGWIANRNALVSAVFGLLALLFHDRASRGEARARWLAAGCLGLGLLGGEGALGAVGYLAAHALVLDARPWRERARDLAPHALVLAPWVALYRLGGYGATGSGMYLDPGRSPLRVLRNVPEYAALLVASEWGSVGPEAEILMPPAGRAALLVVAVLTVIVGLVALAPLLRARPSTRFLLLGAILSLLPGCATMPATRLLLLPGLGLMGVVAEALAELVAQTSASAPPRGLSRLSSLWFAIWVGCGHLVLSPLLIGPTAWQMVVFQDVITRLAGSFPPDDAALSSQRLVVVNTPDATFAGYFQILRDADRRSVARGMLALTNGTRPSELRRVSDTVVEVRAPGGFYQWATDFLVRDPEVPMPVGTEVRLSDVTIEVVHTTDAGVPDVARLTFAASVDDPRFRWAQWANGKYVAFTVPAVGNSVTVAARSPGS